MANPTVTLLGSWDSGYTSSTVTSKQVVRDQAVSAGDVLIVCVRGNQNNNVSSVVDGQFGTLSTYSKASAWDSTDNSWMQFFWATATQNYSGSSANNVTATFSSATGYAEVIAAQFRCSSGYSFANSSGLLDTSTLRVDIAPGTAPGAIISGSTNFGSVPALAFAAAEDVTGSGGQTVANGWTSTFTGNSGNFVPSWSVITSTGYQQASWTSSSSGGSDNYITLLIGLNIIVSGVTVSSVNGGAAVAEGSTGVPFTGSGFAGGMTANILQSQSGTQDATVAQSNVAFVDSTDGKFDLVMEPGTGSQLAFSDSVYTHSLQVTVSGTSVSGSIAGGLTPQSGLLFVTLTSVNATSSQRITATPDLAVNDQLEASGNSSGTAAAPPGLVLNSDGTFQFSSGFAPQNFYVRAYDGVNLVWGPYALQGTGVKGAVSEASTSADSLTGQATFSASVAETSTALDTEIGSTTVIAASLSDAAASSDRVSATQAKANVSVSPAFLAGALVGAPYKGSLVASGGIPPYTFAVSAGSLPAGVSLSPTGILYGTPTVSGSYSFTATASDSGNRTGSAIYAIPVSPAATTSSILHTTFALDQNAWDMVLDASGNIAVAGAPYAIAQDVATQLKTFRGECWYDTTQGVPYWQQVLGGRPPATLVVADLEEQALNVPDVETATASVLGTDSTRRLIGQVLITDADSNTITVQL